MPSPSPGAEAAPCRHCGYDLRASLAAPCCPECGTPVAFALGSHAPFVRPPDQDHAIDVHLFCVRCGADLFGRRALELCATCQNPVWFSLYGDWLRASDPRWLAGLRRGVLLWFWVLIGSSGLNVLYTGVVTAIACASSPETFDYKRWLDVGLAVIGVFTIWLYLPVIWLITADEPAGRQCPRGRTLEHLLRLGGVLNWGLVLTALLLRIPTAPSWLMRASLLLTAAWLIVYMGMMARMQRLAVRVPAPRLAHKTGVVMWGYAGAQVVLELWGLAATQSMDPARTSGRGTLFSLPSSAVCLLSVASVASIVFLIWLLVLLWQYQRVFKTALVELAKDTAGAGTGMLTPPTHP